MADHAEISKFFDEIIHILIEVRPENADIEGHLDKLIKAINEHAALGDKYAEALFQLNKQDLICLIRFMESPDRRHHIAEIEKLLKDFGPETAGRAFLKHFYDHNKNHLAHAEDLGKVSKH